MYSVLGKIDSIDVPEPQPGVAPRPDEATIVCTLEHPSSGSMTLKLYPLATKEFLVGPCRVAIDQG